MLLKTINKTNQFHFGSQEQQIYTSCGGKLAQALVAKNASPFNLHLNLHLLSLNVEKYIEIPHIPLTKKSSDKYLTFKGL
ncbi:hypothetical protein [Calothrix sp. UHCC 0171]|uniref:hypothetical protein n=1 Tax=Calothrix sp. UHCC 0171 TaxID=3110245 RepID=UPI002B1F1EDC|nr:hypothetical protein [Calothrix sp. UHCC 0171]MEA5572369.1 hypothetical protein [Calothrix sp. UHCC 0171]